MDAHDQADAIFGPCLIADCPGLSGRLYVDQVKPQHRVYWPGERPQVEVLVADVRHIGDLRMWVRREDGIWWGPGAVVPG